MIDMMGTATDRMFLYKAAKYEVQNFFEDCGMTISEMWKMISKDPDEMSPTEQFWHVTCVMDYEEQRVY